jgi:Xaa-Pro aminopeptidase
MKTSLVHEVRAVKNKKELRDIIKAQRISEKVLIEALGYLKDGITELEVEAYIKKSFVKNGAPILSFPPIVAFGKNTANIHHVPNKTKLKQGDLVMFDIGTTVNHYCSDMTRTYFWGEAPKVKRDKQIEIYNAVLKAQNLALEKIKSGERRGIKIDKVARDFIAKKYPDNFKHGLGHGVGTVIHEWPFFGPKSEDIVPVGCVMTVEPGIYIKGFGGVRIEDMVLITQNGYEHLTNLPRDLESAFLK